MKQCLIAILILLSSVVAQAHHSRSPFLLDETFEIEGTVIEVRWRSPHVYVVLESISDNGTAEQWAFEGHSIAGLKGLGWLKDSIEVGDDVVVVANPNRDTNKRFALLDNVKRSDGETFYSFRIPEGKTVTTAPVHATIEPSTDMSGYWWRVSTLRQALVGGFKAPDWPVTTQGRAQLAEFDMSNDPQLDCVPVGVPVFVFYPYSAHWVRETNRIVIDKDQHPLNRVIHLDGSTPTPDYVPDTLGWSTGRFESDGTLVVETSHFSATPWGATRGLDSSDQKKVTERYKLSEDGRGMDVNYTIEDPVYLTEPVTTSGKYRQVAPHEFNDIPCDPETSRRHLQYEQASK